MAEKSAHDDTLMSGPGLQITANGRATMLLQGQYQTVNGKLLVKAQPLATALGITDAASLTHRPGDAFNTRDDAALAWSLVYSPESQRAGQEFQSLIFQEYLPVPDRMQYSFGAPLAGTSTSVPGPSLPVLSAGTKLAAVIHSHPYTLRPGSDTESFSEVMYGANGIYGDELVAEVYGVPLYVATARGALKVLELDYSRAQQAPDLTTRVICNGLPVDPRIPK